MGAVGEARPERVAGDEWREKTKEQQPNARPLLRVEPTRPREVAQRRGVRHVEPQQMRGAMRQRSAGGSQQPADLSSRSFTSPKI